MTHAIYQIKNTVNGHVYVGSAVTLGKRWSRHRKDLERSKHDNRFLQNAWNKHGADAFEFSVLERVESADTLIAREQFWIDRLNAAQRPNYNLCAVAGSRLGIKATEETKEKLRVAMIGNQWNVGYRHTPEARKNMGASKCGQKRTPEQRARMSAGQVGNTNKRGYQVTVETRTKLAAAAKGNQHSKGVVRSEEHRRKTSEAKKAYWAKRKAEQNDAQV